MHTDSHHSCIATQHFYPIHSCQKGAYPAFQSHQPTMSSQADRYTFTASTQLQEEPANTSSETTVAGPRTPPLLSHQHLKPLIQTPRQLGNTPFSYTYRRQLLQQVAVQQQFLQSLLVTIDVIRDKRQAAVSVINEVYSPNAVEADTRFQHHGWSTLAIEGICSGSHASLSSYSDSVVKGQQNTNSVLTTLQLELV